MYSQIVASAMKENEKKDDVGLGLKIPRALKRRVDIACARAGIKMKPFVVQALEEHAEAVEKRLEEEESAA